MSYVPETGDVIWLDFDPQMGNEEAKRRPAVVLSPKLYNQKTSLCVCVPVTTKIKGYPFEVFVSGLGSVALSDHVKSLDYNARNAEFKCRVSEDELREIREKISLLLGL